MSSQRLFRNKTTLLFCVHCIHYSLLMFNLPCDELMYVEADDEGILEVVGALDCVVSNIPRLVV